MESRFAKAQGIVGLAQGIHPETAAVSGGFGRWNKHPLRYDKGVNQNAHLAMDIAHTGMLGGSMETVGKVRIYKAESEEGRSGKRAASFFWPVGKGKREIEPSTS